MIESILMLIDEWIGENTISKLDCQIIIQKSTQRILYANRNIGLFSLIKHYGSTLSYED